MLEEERESAKMDRKPNGRQSSLPPKATGSECKKDGGSSNPRYSKTTSANNGKRWEGGSSRQKYDGPNRRPVPQKSRPPDRRPRPRNYQNDRQREEVTAEPRAEQGSALMKGSKKANLNHLLNFSYSSRDGYGGAGSVRYGGWHGRGKRGGKQSIQFNKEQFLQANCQFVVRGTGDYSVCGVDPDILVDWEMIEQVRIFSHEVPSCPICLYPPTAAKITRCGHIYCWTCMLHYLSLGEKTWRKCPICYEAVHQKDLKSVQPMSVHNFTMGEQITLKLMKRERSSTFTLPKAQWAPRKQPHNIDDSVDVKYSKLLVATAGQVQEIIDAEKTALKVQQQELQADSLEESYVTAAFASLKEREKSNRMAQAVLHGLQADNSPEQAAADDEDAARADATPSAKAAPAKPLSKDVIHYASAFSDEEDDTVEEKETQSEQSSPSASGKASPVASLDSTDQEQPVDVRTTSESSEESPGNKGNPDCVAMTIDEGERVEVSVDVAAEELALPASEEKITTQSGSRGHSNEYYFYQAEDGQHIYLHSINARCLVKQYGSLQNCPESITATIVDIEGISMTEELRRRLKYLGHLPLTCEFRVVELALQPPLVSQDTLDFFAEEIDRRRRQRQRKSRNEQRTLKKSQREAEKKLGGKYPQMGLSVSNIMYFPESESVIVPSEAPLLVAGSSSTSAESTPVGSPPDASAQADSADGQAASFSFAQMLRKGKAKPADAWPRSKSDANATSPDSIKSPGGGGSDEDSDCEDRVPVPTFQNSFGDAIQAALDNYQKSPGKDTAKDQTQASPATSGGGKKKKKQKKLLFTTTMARNW